MKTGRRWRAGIAAALVLASAGAVDAVELAVNLGQDDALDRSGSGTLALGLEVRTDPMATAGAFSFGAGAAVEGDADGDVWLGAGPTPTSGCRGRSGGRRASWRAPAAAAEARTSATTWSSAAGPG